MVICLCHRVSDKDIARAAASGCRDFDALQDELRVGTACGCCLEMAQSVFDAEAGVPPMRCGGCPRAAVAAERLVAAC